MIAKKGVNTTTIIGRGTTTKTMIGTIIATMRIATMTGTETVMITTATKS